MKNTGCHGRPRDFHVLWREMLPTNPSSRDFVGRARQSDGPSGAPAFRQVAVVRRQRVTGFSCRNDEPAGVEIGQIENTAITGVRERPGNE